MTKTRRAVIHLGCALLASAVVAVSLAEDGWADYFEDFEDYAIEVSPGDPFDDIPTGWFNDNGDFRTAYITEDPADPANNVYLVSIYRYGSSMYGTQEFSDFDVSFRFRNTGFNDDLNFLFRSPAGQINYFYPAGYWVRIQAGLIRFGPNGDGGSLGFLPIAVPYDVWHTMRVVAEGPPATRASSFSYRIPEKTSCAPNRSRRWGERSDQDPHLLLPTDRCRGRRGPVHDHGSDQDLRLEVSRCGRRICVNVWFRPVYEDCLYLRSSRTAVPA